MRTTTRAFLKLNSGVSDLVCRWGTVGEELCWIVLFFFCLFERSFINHVATSFFFLTFSYLLHITLFSDDGKKKGTEVTSYLTFNM